TAIAKIGSSLGCLKDYGRKFLMTRFDGSKSLKIDNPGSFFISAQDPKKIISVEVAPVKTLPPDEPSWGDHVGAYQAQFQLRIAELEFTGKKLSDSSLYSPECRTKPITINQVTDQTDGSILIAGKIFFPAEKGSGRIKASPVVKTDKR